MYFKITIASTYRQCGRPYFFFMVPLFYEHLMKIYYVSFWNIILKDEKLFPMLSVGWTKVQLHLWYNSSSCQNLRLINAWLLPCVAGYSLLQADKKKCSHKKRKLLNFNFVGRRLICLSISLILVHGGWIDWTTMTLLTAVG